MKLCLYVYNYIRQENFLFFLDLEEEVLLRKLFMHARYNIYIYIKVSWFVYHKKKIRIC